MLEARVFNSRTSSGTELGLTLLTELLTALFTYLVFRVYGPVRVSARLAAETSTPPLVGLQVELPAVRALDVYHRHRSSAYQ